MLKGKTALVTGSTSGIGLGIAKSLARQGANIVLNGFGDAEGPKAEVAALGVKVAYHGADMSKPAEIEDMMKFAAAQGISNADATKQLLGEKEPSMQFTTPEELGELAVFFCSPAGNNVRGVAWNMDGGWAAQ
jgi:NAD(P)-dependent dehydrogenase (short-subunit alcohol dehydrogenase family)